MLSQYYIHDRKSWIKIIFIFRNKSNIYATIEMGLILIFNVYVIYLLNILQNFYLINYIFAMYAWSQSAYGFLS